MCNKACISFGAKYLLPHEINNKDILEVGSLDVNGSLRSEILKSNPRKYIGVDIANGPGVDEICDATNLVQKYSKRSFDIVIATEVLEHVLNWKLAISNMKNVVKFGGIILITTRSIGYPKHNYPNDFWRFETEDMKYIFSDCIIEEIEADPTAAGVFVKVKKPIPLRELNLKNYKTYDVNTETKK